MPSNSKSSHCLWQGELKKKELIKNRSTINVPKKNPENIHCGFFLPLALKWIGLQLPTFITIKVFVLNNFRRIGQLEQFFFGMRSTCLQMDNDATIT